MKTEDGRKRTSDEIAFFGLDGLENIGYSLAVAKRD